MQSGTQAEPFPQKKRSGRYKVLEADGEKYLYIPELQDLFSLKGDTGNLLQAAEYDPVTVASQPESLASESEEAIGLIQSVISNSNREALSSARHLAPGIKDVVLHVSQKCNLNCSYCYAVEMNKINSLMTIDVASKVVEHTTQLATQGLNSVKFLGGEPTLAWDVIEWCMKEYIKSHGERGFSPPRFTTVTNGTIVDKKIVESARKYNMYVLVSLDGTEDIHDLLRPFKGGQGSYAKASQGLTSFLDAGVDIAVESVYTRDHYEQGITPSDMIDHFLSLGIRQFAIAPTVGVWHSCDTIDKIDDVAGQFEKAARRSIRSFATESPHLLRGIQFVLDGFSLREERPYVCGAGRTFMAINYNGEAFPCYLLQSSATSYGVIGETWSNEKYAQISEQFWKNGKDHHKVCRECWANEICQSCLGTSWQISPQVSKPPTWFCTFQKRIIGGVLGEICDIRKNGEWQIFLANISDYLRPLSKVFS